jgi:hypothetical protein
MIKQHLRSARTNLTKLAQSENAFREVAKYAYAMNQSRARFVMDPIYEAVCAWVLKDVKPNPLCMEEKVSDSLYIDYRKASRKLQYFIEDWNFDEARPDLLTPRQRIMMHTVALGETSGSAVADSFLRSFRTHPELAAFFGTWFVEELNHFMGYHLYLATMGEAWDAQRGLDVARTEFVPYATDTMEVAAANMYQELIGFLVYASFSRQARDPFLAKMLMRFAKDEMRHYKFYQQIVVREIQRDPSFRRTVLKVVLKSTTPYNQVSGGVTNILHHLELGTFYFRKPEYEHFLKELGYLLGDECRSFFDWFFKEISPPCTVCARELVQCDCKQYETDDVVEARNPDWWREVSKDGERAPAVDVQPWVREMLTRAPERRASSSA